LAGQGPGPGHPVTVHPVVFGAAAYVASMTTCWLSWPAAVSYARTSRWWRHRSRWPGLAPGWQSGHVNAGPPSVIGW